MDWDPAKHPRKPAGSPAGGEFALSSAVEKLKAVDRQLRNMTASRINNALTRLAKLSSQHNDMLIAAGRGNERPSDRAGKIDPLSALERQLQSVKQPYLSEIERRMGSGYLRVGRGVRGR